MTETVATDAVPAMRRLCFALTLRRIHRPDSTYHRLG